MIQKIRIYNYLGESMDYLISGVQENNSSGMIITNIEGLGPTKANVNMTERSTSDGSKFNSARLTNRNIVITAEFTHASSIEEARLLSYRMFPVKKPVKIIVFTDNREVTTDGYVESNVPYIFEEHSYCTISILCESAYFESSDITYALSRTQNATNATTYNGDEETGMNIVMDVVTNYSTAPDITEVHLTKYETDSSDYETLDLDISKMATLVPDSSVNKSTTDTLFMTYSGNKYRTVFSPLPFSISSSGGSAVVFNNELHVFYGVYHKKWNGTSWTSLSNMSFDTKGTTAVVFNGAIHILGVGETGHYVSNSAGTSFSSSSECPCCMNSNIISGPRKSVYAIVLNNRLYVYAGSYMSSQGPEGEDGASFQVITEYKGGFYVMDTSGVWSELEKPPTDTYDENYTPYEYGTIGGGMVIFNDEIHLLGGDDSLSHLVYRSDHWVVLNDLPIAFNKDGCVLAYDNEIHMFCKDYKFETVGKKTTMVYYTCHEAYNGETWRHVDDSDVVVYRSLSCYMDGVVFFIGGEHMFNYSTEPNNDKLIDGDRIVINTYKGQKSITLIRGDNAYNIINTAGKNPKWFKMVPGRNTFKYSLVGASSAKMDITIVTTDVYQGV